MRVLVTGGAGYVGWSVVHELARRDGVDEIIIYDNFARRHYGLLLVERPSGAAKIRVIVDELLNSRALRKAVTGVDCVIHLAAVAPSPDIDEKPHVFDQVNHWGTAELGYAVEQAGTPRLVYLSSGAVYGHPDTIAETTTRPLPVNAYGRSKLAGERQLERLTDQHELRIIRSGTVYGVNPAARFDTFVNRFLLDAALGRSLNVNGSGEQVRPIVPVDIVASQVVDAALGEASPAISHAVTESITVNQVIESLKAIDASLDVIYINQQQRLGGLKMTPAPDHIEPGGAQTASLAERLKTDLARLALTGAGG
jgi:UDP-glucose 4-epimerase